VHLNNQMMQDSSTGTSKTFRANLILQKVVHIMKGNFGLSAKKLQYETLQDQNDETPRKLSYSNQILDMMLNSHHSFKNKVGTAFNNVQTQIKETVNVDKNKICSYRPKKRKTICLRCGNNVTNVSSVAPEVLPCECGDNHGCQCQDLHFNPILLNHSTATTISNCSPAPVCGEEEIYPTKHN